MRSTQGRGGKRCGNYKNESDDEDTNFEHVTSEDVVSKDLEFWAFRLVATTADI